MNKNLKRILPAVLALIFVLGAYKLYDYVLTVKPGDVEQKGAKIEKVNKEKSSKDDKEDTKKKSEEKKKEDEPKIPNLVGLDLKTAKWLIKKNKCEVGNVTYETSDAVYDTVLKQTPEPGKKNKDKVVINIVLSNGAGFGMYESKPPVPVKKEEPDKDEDEDKEDENQNNGQNQNGQGQGQNQGQGQTPGQGTQYNPNQGVQQPTYPEQGQQQNNQSQGVQQNYTGQ